MKRQHPLIMGKNCIREVLRSSPERFVTVYTCQKNKNDPLRAELDRKHIPVHMVSKKDLYQLVHSESHQSYVAAVKERAQPGLKQFLSESTHKKTSLVLMLDSIYDPQNLGALLRCGECFGVDLVVFSKNRGADISPVVSKVSSGATELVPIIKVSNLSETMKQFQNADYWVVCADAGEDSSSIYNFQYPKKTLLVLGSEGKGVQKLLLRNSDYRIQIPMVGTIDSLNVSQAAAIFLNCYRMQHNPFKPFVF